MRYTVRAVSRGIGWLAHLEERGVTSVEYALLATLIAAAISGAVLVFGQAVAGLFNAIIGTI